MRDELVQEQLTGRLIGAFFAVYNELGAGFAEGIYHTALEMVFSQEAIRFQREPHCDVMFRERVIGHCRPDFVINNKVIIELKAVSTLLPEHAAQVSNYLRASGLQVGLLLNFGPKAQIRRVVATSRRGAIHVNQI